MKKLKSNIVSKNLGIKPTAGVKNAEKAVFGSKIKGFSVKSKKSPGIDMPKPKRKF